MDSSASAVSANAALEIPNMPSPYGGNGLGYGESLTVEGATGSLQFSVPIHVSAARSLTPVLTLRYGNSRSNGLYGLGFGLELPAISRRTSKGIPRYNAEDQFVTEKGDVLVPRYDKDASGRWKPAVWTSEYRGVEYQVRAYRRRVEAQFDRIECWTSSLDGRAFWKITDSGNVTHVFGETADARLADPEAPEKVFRWMLQHQSDAKGNRSIYRYRTEVSGQAVGLYPDSIWYGNYRYDQQDTYAFCLTFQYEARPDPLLNYRPGFAVCTTKRGSGFSMMHYFPVELGPEPVEVGRTELQYSDVSGCSCLQRLRRTGLRHVGEQVHADALPDVRFAFHPPTSDLRFQPLRVDKGELPVVLPQNAMAFVDLNGDGLAGILADRSANRAPRYWSPQGNGLYAPGAYLPLSPVTPLNQPARSVLLDLTGTGRRDSLLLSANRAGFYGNNNPGWDPYLPLQSNNTTLTQPDSLFMDLSGSGRVDMLSAGPDGWQYCESLGRAGFAAPIHVQSPLEMPLYQSNSEAIFIGFLNVFGDGLSHLVEVASGYMRVWPSLGYGRFGSPRLIEGIPILPATVVSARLLFADLTGVGGADLAVVHADHVDIYLNNYGQSFRYHATVALPADFGTLDAVQTSDVLGLGINQLLLSFADQPANNQYLDLCGGANAYLLASVKNGMGVSTELRYRSSSDYFLKDQATGRPWLTRLPFPVPVVDRIEQTDEISGTLSVQSMQYGNGYFDPYERQFTGFAYSQQQNSLTVDASIWHFPGLSSEEYRALNESNGEVKPGSEPRFQRSWMYVGDWEQQAALRAQMLASVSPAVKGGLILPAPVLAEDFNQEPVASVWLAYRALATRAVLTEVAGVDAHGSTKPVPYAVTQQAWCVNLVQPELDGHSAVVVVCEREFAESQFEQHGNDPHIRHQVQTRFSEYGQPLQRVEIGYARSAAVGREVLPAQARAQLRMTTTGVINHLDGGYHNANGGTTVPLKRRDEDPFHVVGLPFENQSFELANLPAPSPYYGYSELSALVEASLRNLIAYGEPFTGNGPEARLSAWQQTEYWAGDSLAVLQETAPQLCTYRTAQAAFPETFVRRYLEDKVAPAYLQSEGGYRFAHGYWWNDGQMVSYAGPEQYYQPLRFTDSFQASVLIGYDRYALLMTSKIDPLGYSITAQNDYQALAPWRLVDENQNVSEYLFDGLAEVIVSTRFGTAGGHPAGNKPLSDYRLLPVPDLQTLLNDPAAYVQGASQYFLYRLNAWESDPPLPVYTVELFRRNFVQPPDPSEPSEIGIRLRYFDGNVRDLATAKLVSGQPPYRAFGQPVTAWHSSLPQTGAESQESQWVFSDQQRYDPKGNAIVKYQPYFADLPVYQARPAAASWTMHYDALDRLIKGQTPEGFLTATEYQPWWTRYWDQDDTVTQSPYYLAHIHDPELPPAERAALEMAAGFANTPLTVEQDVFARRIQDENILILQDGEHKPLRNYLWYDDQDRLTALADPRFYNPQQPDRPAYYNFFVQYDMLGHATWQKSADAGNQPLQNPQDGIPWLRLYDVTGGLIDEWDRRGIRHHRTYNVLRQPLSLSWLAQDLDCLVVRYTYGSDADQNTVNRLIRVQDQAGELHTLSYSLLGDATHQNRRYLVAHTGPTDWRTSPPLQETVWAWENRQNAQGEPSGYRAPNGSETKIGLSLNGWPQRLQLCLNGHSVWTTQASVDAFTPQGTAKRMTLANGVSLDRTYDEKSLRLRSIHSQVSNVSVQNIVYTYDPVGNVTNQEILTPPPGSPIQPTINYPARYNSVYQLIFAAGLRTDRQDKLGYYQRDYRYDLANNLTEVVDDGGPDYSSRFKIATFANHAILEQTSGSPDQYYDADGFLIALPDQTRLATDAAGNLASATAIDGGVTYAQYADDLSRLRKVWVPVEGAQQQTYYLDPFIAEGDPKAASSLTLFLGGDAIGLARFPEGSEGRAVDIDFQLSDRLNSVLLRLDQQGQVVDRQEYYPYGTTAFHLVQSPLLPGQQRYQYTGQEKDPSTGLYRFQKRYLAPQLSRWIAPDPAGTIDGSNLFCYARANPLTLHDPTGECGEKPQKKGAFPQMPLKFFAMSGLYGNVLGEAFAGMLRLHESPWHYLKEASKQGTVSPILKAAGTIQFGNIAGQFAVFGGTAGFIYHSMNMKKYGLNPYDASSIVGNSLFIYEGFSIIKALNASGHDLHRAHARIGVIGMFADMFKMPYYLKTGEYEKAALYGGLAVGNWRASVSTEVAQRLYYNVASWMVSPYNRMALSRNYPVMGKELLQQFAINAAKAQSWQILTASTLVYTIFSLFENKEKKQ